MTILLFAEQQHHADIITKYLASHSHCFCHVIRERSIILSSVLTLRVQVLIICDPNGELLAKRIRNELRNIKRAVRVVDLPTIYGELASPEWELTLTRELSPKWRPKKLSLGQRLQWRPRRNRR